MSLIVQKYGGTSVGSPEKIKAVAERVLGYSRKGHQMVVVLSAMSGETDRLTALANSMQEQPDTREMDVLLSTGEQVTISLFAMAIKAAGFDAISFLGDQIKIQTSSMHTKARIQSVDTDKVQVHLAQGKIVVVAGFQGVDENGNITTLGRGGSDTSAVAIAAALGAEYCEICSDVDGVFSGDPAVISAPRKRFSSTVNCGTRENSWNTAARPAARAAVGPAMVTGWPSRSAM